MQTLKKALYDNCQALSPAGEHMFYCSKTRAESYLRRNLAVVVSEEPFVFQLTFEPAGVGDPDLPPKSNFCECCKTTEELTRHHVIPYSFRKLMPNEWKDNRSEDVVPLCRTCHSEYEKESDIYREELFEIISEELEEIELQEKARKAVRTLENQGFFLDKTKMEMLRGLAALYKGDEQEFPSPEQLLMNKITDLADFCQKWKEHYAAWLKVNEK